MQDFNYNEHGAFFAFTTEQLNKNKKEGVEYEQGDFGLIFEKGTKEKIEKLASDHYINECKKRIEQDGIENIVKYEIENHECGIEGNLYSVMRLTKYPYNAPLELLQKELKKAIEKEYF